MNQIFLLVLWCAVSYLFGSILFAIPITKIAIGKDIRKIGNKNPGSSNTMRNAGKMAGTLTAILDITKGIVPIVLARIYFLKGDGFNDWFFLYLIGMAAILGHCRPFWNKLKKGGGGMGTAVGVCAFFVPVEFAIAIILGVLVAFIFMKEAEFKFGRWSMMFAAVILPFLVLIINPFVHISLFAHISLGGHSVGIMVGAFCLLVELFLMNSYELFHWLKNPKDKVNPLRKGEN